METEKKLFTIVLFAIMVGIASSATAEDIDSPSLLAVTYMTNINNGNYDLAMTYIDPDQLTLIKERLLPVLIGFVKNKNKDLRDLGTQMIGNDESEWQKVTGERILVYFLKISMSRDKVAKERMQRTKLEVVDTSFRNNRQNARVQLNCTIDSKSFYIYGSCLKREGKWYIDFSEEMNSMIDNIEKIAKRDGI